MFWTRLLITAAWLSLTASAGAASTPTGFHGHVTIGPLTPVCTVSTPCDGPAKSVTLSFARNGTVKRVVTNAFGNYRVLLPAAGYYTVTANRGMSLRPRRVWAHRGYVPKLNFAIDTGIR
jgi:hypothetical protein